MTGLAGLDFDRMVAQAPTQMFLHIQKTAGSSVRDSLSKIYQPRRVARLYEHDVFMRMRDFVALPPETRAAFRLIIGHIPYGLHALAGRPTRYCAFLRDPMERIRSHYQQHLLFSTVFDLGHGPVDLVTVINEGLTDEFDNLQLRMIGGVGLREAPLGTIGEPDLRRAIANMVTMFGFVGLTERLEEDWPRLLAYLGAAPQPLVRSNITPDELRVADDPDFKRIDWPRVQARHAYEIALHRYASSRPALAPAPVG